MHPTGLPAFAWIYLLNAVFCGVGALVAWGLHRPASTGQRWIVASQLFYTLLFLGLWRLRHEALPAALLKHLWLLADLFVPAAWLFLRQLRKDRGQMVVGSTLLLAFWLLEIYFLAPLPMFPRFTACLFAGTATALCIHYFFRLAQSPLVAHFVRHPGFWLVMGFLPYCSISLLLQVAQLGMPTPQPAALLPPLALLQTAALLWRAAAIIIAFRWYRHKSISGPS